MKNNLLSTLVASAFAVGISAVPNPIASDLATPLCNIPNYKPARQSQIRIDIDQLHAMSGQDCTAPAGPGGCARVSCLNGGAVWMCNDNTAPSRAPCSVLGDYAQTILDVCGYEDMRNHHYLVQGQLFNAGPGPDGSRGWGNVLVGFDEC
ncbi:hypothetical protein PG994_010032 [Apiospora phragmitis]|uniref:Uncharacterized protein n=1 Tax=Apiospora phragmitis TaxID=2905665 RepID=A0ABR1TNX3_9PEZI